MGVNKKKVYEFSDSYGGVVYLAGHVRPQAPHSVLGKQSSRVTKTLIMLSCKTLNPTQKNVLEELNRHEKRTLSSLLPELAGQINVAESTVRRAAAMLRENGLVECGSADNKNVGVRLTPTGKTILEAIK